MILICLQIKVVAPGLQACNPAGPCRPGSPNRFWFGPLRHIFNPHFALTSELHKKVHFSTTLRFVKKSFNNWNLNSAFQYLFVSDFIFWLKFGVITTPLKLGFLAMFGFLVQVRFFWRNFGFFSVTLVFFDRFLFWPICPNPTSMWVALFFSLWSSNHGWEATEAAGVETYIINFFQSKTFILIYVGI